MNTLFPDFNSSHRDLTRRYFISLGAMGVAALKLWSADEQAGDVPELTKAIEALEPYFTDAEKFRDVSRGKPLPHSLSDEKKRAVGMSRETWKLEVVADPENPASIRKPLTQKEGTALDFPELMKLAEKHA